MDYKENAAGYADQKESERLLLQFCFFTKDEMLNRRNNMVMYSKYVGITKYCTL